MHNNKSKPIPKNNDANKIPTHVAIIMDGNGRWAKKRHLPRIAGHKKGAENVTTIVKAASDIGVKYLTLYTFSTENWRRPQDEVSALMDLFEKVLIDKFNELMKNGVRLNLIGDLSAIRETTRTKFEDAINKTKDNDKIVLSIALNYSGRDEIVRAVNKIIKDGVEKVDENIISANLDTANIADPELLIRTSGEIRISNFLLWQIAYSEIFFTDALWPDFGPKDLQEAIDDFQRRERRFGGLK